MKILRKFIYRPHVRVPNVGYGAVAANGCTVSAPRKVVAFGNVLLDRTAKVTDTELLQRYQMELETRGELDTETLAKVTAEACERFDCVASSGGSALNTTRILKHLGTEATFFGAIGEDKPAEELKEILKSYGVEANLQTVSDVPTGQCIVLVYENNSALYANIGASSKFSIDHLKHAENHENNSFLRPIERKQIIYIEGFFIPKREKVCDYIIKNYIRERRRLAINLSAPYIVQQNYAYIVEMARVATFIFGNEHEFRALVDMMGCDSLEKLARKLLTESGSSAKIIVVTKGASGADLITNFIDEYSPAGQLSFESYNAPRVTEVMDPSGAGDAFVGAFLHAWLEKRSLSECVRVATDVAAKTVTQIGCHLP